MKSIKPGRGPSLVSGFVCILAGVFGIIWTFLALSMGGGAFALFGLIFIAIAVINAIYNFKNATGKNRYSSFDITDSGEEPDPFNERFGNTINGTHQYAGHENRFCPWCGATAKKDFEFCNKCGKKLP